MVYDRRIDHDTAAATHTSEPEEASSHEEPTSSSESIKFTGTGMLPPIGSESDVDRGPTASERAYGPWQSTQPVPTHKLGRLQRARLGQKGRAQKVLGDAHEISNQDIILEQLAHRGAYGGIPAERLAAWGYRNAGAVDDPESGFRAVLYVPDSAARDAEHAAVLHAVYGGAPPPVVAFRGTANRRGAQDDVNRHGVGAYQFASNEAKIAALLAVAGGKVIATGHSLGGALAQLAATHFASQVQRVVTFQSPGISNDEAAKLVAHNANAAPEDQIRSTHHRAQGDLVHLAGESLTEGDVFTFRSVGIGNAMDHTRFPLARLAAARGDLIPGINDALLESGKADAGGDRLVGVDKTSTTNAKSGALTSMSESVRKSFGGVVRDETMEHYVSLWNDIKRMVASGAFSTKYILGVIDGAPKLTDVQRVKMRDQVRLLAELGPGQRERPPSGAT
jgi:pimeloyl-ACP methyl ester carboxylesterase